MMTVIDRNKRDESGKLDGYLGDVRAHDKLETLQYEDPIVNAMNNLIRERRHA